MYRNYKSEQSETITDKQFLNIKRKLQMENLRIKTSVSENEFKSVLSKLNSEQVKEFSQGLENAANLIARIERAVTNADSKDEIKTITVDLPFITGEHTLFLQLSKMADIAKTIEK